ncbi:bacteriorhodopsin [Neolewinella xylanilytica]|uniref:Bacteriorhodopsin n=1 Tax=Neolewinella xylanilytica TaxID=1514080 RepID=A0A2S6I523_9BACT|nr:bacteriorhodopsin [Neolewinella xylanilytica]PPK86191.1 bacteriorhodopsin [Neolewinella xylanilytica]
MTNIESLYTYSTSQYEAVDHLLSMGVGAHFAALIFFILLSRFIAPRYRTATALSCIVMVSAGTILYGQSGLWENAFTFDQTTGLYTPADATFSNGYRYVNWMVTIPCLLTQLLIVLDIRGNQLFRDAGVLILLAWGMIVTGYVGQLYETTDLMQLTIWGAISTVFFVAMNWIVGTRIFRTLPLMPPTASGAMRKVFWLMMFAWTLYPLAYAVPYFAPSAGGVVIRQALFTVADVSSKAVYGIMITYIALQRSAAEGFEPAMQVNSLSPQKGTVAS